VRHLFPAAIGEYLARSSDGLVGVYLPAGIGRDEAVAIARRANSTRPSDPPFAIVVSDHPSVVPELDVIETDSSGATRYRQGARLAVFYGPQVGLHSVVDTFRTVLSPSFPEDEIGPLNLQSLADTSLDLALEEAGVAGRTADDRHQLASKRLAEVFRILRTGHMSMGGSSTPWNSRWFRHASAGLELLTKTLQRAEPAADLYDLLAKYTYAAFSLPTPDNGLSFTAAHLGRSALSTAVNEWWSDGETISSTIVLLGSHPRCSTPEHGLAKLDWSNFDRTKVNAQDDPLLAFAIHEAEADSRVSVFAQLSESQYFQPIAADGTAQLELLSSDRVSLEAPDVSSGLNLISGSTLEWIEGRPAIVSPPIRVVVPTLRPLTQKDLEGSRLRFTAGNNSASFEAELTIEDGALTAIGRLRDVQSPNGFSFRPTRRSLALSFDAKDPLTGLVDPKASADYMLFPPQGAGAVFFALTGNRVSAPKWVGTSTFDRDGRLEMPDSTLTVETKAGVSVRLLLWSSSAASPTVQGRAVPSLGGLSGLWTTDFEPAGNDRVTVGDVEIEVLVESGGSQPASPVVAAILKCVHSDEQPPESIRATLRGRLEEQLASIVVDSNWADSLGHFLLPVDEAAELSALVPAADGAVQTTQAIREEWHHLGIEDLTPAVVGSAEAQEFRAAFEALRVGDRLVRDEGEAGSSNRWPSQISWADLVPEESLLDRYLDAYSGLIAKARKDGRPIDVVWATFPFSVSAWSTRPAPAKLRAVMVSPLHPLRLAWLASVEDALRQSPLARRLCGTIEGWNLPLVGPTDSPGGRMIAVPIDNGDDQLFLGWSMLVRGDVDGASQLISPEFVGGHHAPGTSASGLNSGGVASAIRDYRRINPHVSTLTIDLAASVSAPRLTEIDEAVLSEVCAWASAGGEALPGGARIMDSLDRRGVIPREHLRSLVGDTLEAPITWTRYEGSSRAPKAANLRILQDSGVAVGAETESRAGFGVLARCPFRRFEIPEPIAGDGSKARLSPGLRPEGGWQALVRAIQAAEGSDGDGNGTSLVSTIVGGLLTSADAEWTVSGESMVNPASLAAQLQRDEDTSSMLWEWRPPFLELDETVKGASQLERRPYLSVVRIPGPFRHQLTSKLAEIDGSSEDAMRTLRVLGGRGVGLSSLVSMGGSHSTGALGFYLTMMLAASVDSGDADQLVLPIDVCDKFLLALASAGMPVSERRRADLLVMTIDDDTVTLVPIEIKFYGLTSPHPAFPSPESQALYDPLDQLAATQGLLHQLAREWEDRRSDHPGGPDHRLAANGLASLVEAGMRLSPKRSPDRARAAKRMSRIANGEIEVRVGRPILTYFLHGARGPGGSLAVTHVGLADNRPNGCGIHGQFMANPAAALQQLHNGGGDLVNDWQRLAAWATEAATAPPEKPKEPSAAAPEIAEDFPLEAPTTREVEPIPGAVGESGAVISGPEPAQEFEPEPAPIPAPGEAIGQIPRADRIVEDGVRFPVGMLLGSVGQAEADFWPSNTDLNQLNIGVVGDLGTGKTQLLKALLLQLRRSSGERQPTPISTLIFDYKGDFQDDDFLMKVGGRVLKPRNIPLNIFGMEGEYGRPRGYERARAFLDVIARVYAGVGPVQRNRIVETIMALYEQKGAAGPTMAEVLESYRSGGQADSVVAVLNTFVLGEIFSEDRAALVPFGDMLHDTVLVVDLKSLGVDQDTKNALVALFLNQYFEHMQGLTRWPYQGSQPQLRRLNSFLVVDEAINIMKYRFEVLENLMLQGREFGVGVILSSQYLTHFEQPGTNYGEPLRTWFIHKVPQVTQRNLASIGLPTATQQDANRISELGLHEVYYSSLGYPGRFVRCTPYWEMSG
jgi:DNA phosphorothioation-dependent restriction protein DptH